MKPHVKLAKNEQVWHGVSSSYFSIFSFIYFLFYLFFLLLLLVVFSFLFFLFSFSSSCRNSLLAIFNN
jgi:hypothetical protein